MMRINMKIGRLFFNAAAISIVLGACSEQAIETSAPLQTSQIEKIGLEPGRIDHNQEQGDVFVHLFEWRWLDIAAECEDFLGPNGYAAVQVSPPQEHITGPQWWTRYQPVSYRIESRSGTRAEFAEMVKRCKAAGVGIYADTIINHMADVGSGTGIAGSEYTEFNYPVPYGYDDFHHCGRNGDGSISNYQDLWEIQSCSLGQLPDLNTGKPAVQKKIAAYINDMLRLGVSGIRLDAAKHVSHHEVEDILFLVEASPFVFQEVIDRGDEPIDGTVYTKYGMVTEFKYPQVLLETFGNGQLEGLTDLGKQAGFLPSAKAIVFIDNHDTQRGHAGADDILSYKRGELYNLANVFMLAWPYGYPKVMSSYRFENREQGPPGLPPVLDGACSEDWVCEHRRAAIKSMVGFRKITAGTAVTNWQTFRDKVVSFSRSDMGHVVINMGNDTVDGTYISSMKAGNYCNVVGAGVTSNGCKDAPVRVDSNGVMHISVAPMSAVAIHADSLL